MFIKRSLNSVVNLCTTFVQGKVAHHQESKTMVLNNPQVEISTETLSKAALDKQPDGTLRFMTINRFGLPESRIFKNEERLDHYLSQHEMIDIWEIEDKRERKLKIIYKYKYCVWDEEITFSSKDELLREIASGTDHGVFHIHDVNTQEGVYIQQKKGWFQQGFEKVSLAQAQETLCVREAAQTRWRKSYALGIAVLAAAPAIVGVGKTLSKNWEELKTTVSVAPSYPLTASLQKTTIFMCATLLTYGMSSISGGPGKSLPQVLPTAMLGSLSWFGFAVAQPCPLLAGSYDTPGYAVGVTVSGSYAYVADSDVGGLQIIDVSNKTNPTRVGWYDTPGEANRVVVSGSYAYVADDDVGGLQIIDVSNKTNPTRVGWYDTPGVAWGVAVSGSYAYVADDDVGGLQIIDVSNKTNPTRVGWYDTPGVAWGVAFSDNYAYVADLLSLLIIDVSNKANPVRVGEWDDGFTSVVGLALSGNYVYVAADFSGLQIIDVSNKANPILVGSDSTLSSARDVAVSGTYAYVADHNSGLHFFDVSNVTNPIRVGGYGTPGFSRGVALSAPYAYVADGSSLQIIDVFCLLSSTTSSLTTSTLTSTSSTNQPSFSSTTLTNFSQSNSSVSLSISSESSYTNTLSNQRSSISSNTLLPTTSRITTIPLTADSASNNSHLLRISLGVGIAGLICLGATGTTFFYLLKKRKYSKDVATSRRGSKAHSIFELKPVMRKGYNEIGEKYYQLSAIRENEAQEIYLQTGHLIIFPDDMKKIKYMIGRGRFGAIKVAQRIEDGQYVVSKKVKGEENIAASEVEANLQRESAGENILPIYNTIRLENSLYHFMPLAGLGDGCVIQRQLIPLHHQKLSTEILKFVAKDLLTGLKTLHGKGIYHLDIKPDNLVFTKEGTGYITDFGCAKKSYSPQIPSDAIGDNRYFSPERLQACKNGTTFNAEKADLWAAGVTLLQIMKNMHPIQLLEMPDSFVLRVQRCDQDYFQERFKNIYELQYPKEGTIWWVIKGLLDSDLTSCLSVNEGLAAACFKGLNNSLREKVFENFVKETLAQNTKSKTETIDINNYGGIAQAAAKREMPPIYDSEQHQKFYVEESRDRWETSQDVRLGMN